MPTTLAFANSFDRQGAGIYQLKGSKSCETHRDCRRLQLLRRRSRYEQDNAQVFTQGSRPCGSDDIGSRRRLSIALVGRGVGCRRDRLRTADASRVGEEVEVDSGKRAGVPTDTADKLKALEREVRELRHANEILRKASAYFAQAELDRPFKR